MSCDNIATMTTVDVTIYYLQMRNPARLRPRACAIGGWQVRRAAASIETNRDFYRAVGADWYWLDRLRWADDRWQAYIDQRGLETWIGYVDDQPIGYFELDHQPTTGVEIVYFGLLPAFIGQGLGGVLLSEAVARAWRLEPSHVWLHTCTLDHPQALPNYLARGFDIYKTETQSESID